MSEPVTAGTELIAGMEQVILHIQHQESSIQELKKSFEQAQEKAKKVDIKNKELETANNFLSNIVEEQTKKIDKLNRDWVEERDDLNEHISMLRKDKTKLKQECDGQLTSIKTSYGKLLQEYEELHEDCCSRMNKEQEAELKQEIKQLKETCDHLNNTSMGDAHDYEVLSEKMANDSETFVGIISDLESQVKSLESENNNLKCVLTTEGIGKHKCKQILKILADDCQPDGWDCM